MSNSQAVMQQPIVKAANPVPTRKVAVGGIAGALTSILVFVLNEYFLPAGKPLPAELAAAMTTLFTFIVSYMVPSAARE